MKLKHPYLLLLPAFLYACSGPVKDPVKKAIASDTLVYHYQTFKKRADDCGNKPDSSCTVITLKYPVFNNQPALNDTVRLRALTLFNAGGKKDTSFNKLATDYLNAYNADLKANPRKLFYTLDTKVDVIRQDSAITTLQVDGYTYQGGAHGASFTGFINWQTHSRKNLNLNDVLVNNYLPGLNKVADSIFRKQENLKDTSSLAADYFFKDARFSVNHNFLLTPLGIRFLYNQYEIKPFAAGQTDLYVPYEKIKMLIKPNTVLAQYHK